MNNLEPIIKMFYSLKKMNMHFFFLDTHAYNHHPPIMYMSISFPHYRTKNKENTRLNWNAISLNSQSGSCWLMTMCDRALLQRLACRAPLFPWPMQIQSQCYSPALSRARGTHYAFNYSDQINHTLRWLWMKFNNLCACVCVLFLYVCVYVCVRRLERSLLL